MKYFVNSWMIGLLLMMLRQEVAVVHPGVNIFFKNVLFDGKLIENIYKLMINTQKYNVGNRGAISIHDENDRKDDNGRDASIAGCP